jgi:ABC-type transport system substrate-binding protein
MFSTFSIVLAELQMRLSILALILVASRSLSENVYTRSMSRMSSVDPVEAASSYAARGIQLAYEPLLEYDYTARPYRLIPCLAESLPLIEDNGRVLIFKINPGARFVPHKCFGSNKTGRPVTASDVVYSLMRIADKKNASPGSWVVTDTILGMRAFAEHSGGKDPTNYQFPVAGLRVVDERTIRIELTKPLQVFPHYLTIAYTAVVPREAVAFYGKAFGGYTVGSGPYQLATWHRNYQMIYERNVDWHGWKKGPASLLLSEKPFDRIVYRMMDDMTTQWLSFLKGELDFLGEVSSDNWDVVVEGSGELSKFLRTQDITLHTASSLEVAYIGINMDDPVLGTNRALRQALNAAFDSAAWNRFYNHRTVQATGPVPPKTQGRLETPFQYAYNLERAKKLMAEAGYPEGIDTKTGRRLELRLEIGHTNQEIRESTELLASFYAKIGIALIPQYQNLPTFLKRVSNRQAQLFRLTWVGDYPDAENFIQLFYSRNVSPGPNRANYVNPSADALYEKACLTINDTERNTLWQEAQTLIREDCPWIFLHYPSVNTLTHSRLMGFTPSDFPYGTEKYFRCR